MMVQTGRLSALVFILHFQCLLSPVTHLSKFQMFHQEKHLTALTHTEPTRASLPFWLIFVLWSLESCIQLPTKCWDLSLVFLWLCLCYCKYFYDNSSGQLWCAAVNFPNESLLLQPFIFPIFPSHPKHSRMTPNQDTYVCVLLAQRKMISFSVRAERSKEYGIWKHTASWNTCLFYT